MKTFIAEFKRSLIDALVALGISMPFAIVFALLKEFYADTPLLWLLIAPPLAVIIRRSLKRHMDPPSPKESL